MTIFTIGLIVLAATMVVPYTARSQSITVHAGESIVLASFYEVDRKTCRPLARPNLWLIAQPTVGRAHVAGTEAVVTAPQCRPQRLPVAQIVYQAPASAAGKVDRLSYGASFQQLDRDHSRTLDIVIQP